IGTCDETGLGLNFWGTQAKEALQKHLKEYYKDDIAAMNAHCGTSYKSFEEVEVPVRKPETPAQHAVWEHFNRCREAYLEFIYGSFYRIVKKHNPDIDVFALPSTGASQLPLYGLNYYNAAKHQDVLGIDGTCCALSREWVFLDLGNKRYLTSEWGELYRESPLPSVYGQMWQELTGGALGLEQHYWSSANDSVNYVDFVNCPTAYGAILHMALKDARKLDHLILDGRRAVPEVGILYSQTSRIHDQGWGWAGESPLSRHMLSVSQYYSHFLSFGRSARVYAAEALLEGKMPPVKILIVPQAEFLSEAVQKALLDYAKNGGQLIIEGRAGKFDEFGRDSYYLFRETGVIPAFTNAGKAVMEKATLAVQKDDPAYSPSGKGKVLAAYDGENPAILTTPCGNGSVTFMGIGLGGFKYSCFAPVLERVMRSLGVNARFKVSGNSVVLREWKHGDDTYLFLSVRNASWAPREITVRFRGKAGVEDYLFGKEVKTDFKDGYTSFRTLVVNGGRVFRLKGKIAPAGTLDDQPDFELASSSGAKDDAKEFALPFKGNLYADTPMKTGDYTFSAAILGSGDNSRQGNAFLTVTGKGEVQKKRLEEGQTIYFRMRGRIFEVKCLRNFFMYPFYTTLEIKEAAALPASSGASAVQNGDEVTLSNDVLSVTFKKKGAVMTSFLP
ncbi:MAG: beta-galactosidase trimerization domain-containing protein, partial [Lentisphaeria bacterium]|nr:beta-galactosidase trimerization domain-containing protein [Lentisphaeria bacterium]